VREKSSTSDTLRDGGKITAEEMRAGARALRMAVEAQQDFRAICSAWFAGEELFRFAQVVRARCRGSRRVDREDLRA